MSIDVSPRRDEGAEFRPNEIAAVFEQVAVPPAPIEQHALTAPDALRESWDASDMQAWLSTTLDSRGQPLELRLDHPLRDQIQRCARAYADGNRGFDIDTANLRFPSDPARLMRLKEALETGSVTGIVLEAYPDEVQLRRIAASLNPTDQERQFEALLAEPVTEFLLQHFEARGGKVFAKEQLVAKWREMRWQSRAGRPLGEAFHVHDASAWLDANGAVTPVYREAHAAVYDSLPAQPRLADMLGQVSVTFTDTRQEAAPHRSDSRAEDGTDVGSVSFLSLLREHVDFLSPTEFAALLGTISDPADTRTYPDLVTWEWQSGITRNGAALVYSTLRNGLRESWESPHRSYAHSRARLAIRG